MINFLIMHCKGSVTMQTYIWHKLQTTIWTIRKYRQKMSTQFQHIFNKASFVDIVLTFSLDIILSSVNIFNGSDYSSKFV